MVINTIVALLLAIRRGHINSFKKQNLIVKIKPELFTEVGFCQTNS